MIKAYVARAWHSKFWFRTLIWLFLFSLVILNAVVTLSEAGRFGFTHDDLMNISWGQGRSWSDLSADVLTPWRVSPVYRPVGVALLKAVYNQIGLDLSRFRAFYDALILLCAGSTFVVTGVVLKWRPLPVLFTSLCFTYHAGLTHLYYWTGHIYDALAYLFVSLMLSIYLTWRSYPNKRWLGMVLIPLYLLSLSSKEVGIAAVAYIFLWEVILCGSGDDCLFRKRRVFPMVILLTLAALLLIFGFSRLLDSRSLAAQNAAYKVHFSVGVFATHLGVWTQNLLCVPIDDAAQQFGWVAIAVLLGLMAILRYKKVTVWGTASFLVGIAPVAFIPQRGLESIVVALLPLLLGLSVAVDDLLSRVFSSRPSMYFFSWLFLVGTLVWYQGFDGSRSHNLVYRQTDQMIMPVLAATQQFQPRVDASQHVIVEADPFEEMQWAPTLLFRLAMQDGSLDVRRRALFTPSDVQRIQQFRRIAWQTTANMWIELAPFPLKHIP